MHGVFNEIVHILCESAVYLLLGFALAGVLHVVLRRTPRFTELLARRGGGSVLLAALFGAPLPLCSCGVVPAGLALYRKGASKGATVSFLISVPETDVVSILLTYALLGPVMAVVRPCAAIVTAIVAGFATNMIDRPTDRTGSERASGACCHGESGDREYDTAHGTVWNALHYGFVRFFDDIISLLLLGVILGGLITAFVPDLGLERLTGGSMVSMLAMLVIGIPMYVCAAASTPIAAGLIAGGLSPGAALVFLLAGPATNLGSLLVLSKNLGRAVLAGYLCSIAVVSVSVGLLVDAVLGVDWLPPSTLSAAHHHSYEPVQVAGAVVLVALAVASFIRRKRFASMVGAVRKALASAGSRGV